MIDALAVADAHYPSQADVSPEVPTSTLHPDMGLEFDMSLRKRAIAAAAVEQQARYAEFLAEKSERDSRTEPVMREQVDSWATKLNVTVTYWQYRGGISDYSADSPRRTARDSA